MTPAELRRQQALLAQQRAAREAAEREARARADADRLSREQEARLAAERAARETARLELEARLRREQEERDAAKREQEARLEREAEARRAAALRVQQEQQARERMYQTGIQAGAVVGGVVLGKRLAKGIEARHIAHLNARANQVTAVGYQAQQTLKGAKGGYVSAAQRTQLAGVVRAADRAGLTRIRGPLGIGMGAMLVGEALFARMVIAPSLDNPTAREAVNQLATASIFAATNLVSTRLIQNRTLGSQPSKPPSPLAKRLGFGPRPGVSLTYPNAKALSSIEAARMVVNEKVPQAAASTVQAARTAATRVASATGTARLVSRGVRTALTSPGTAGARQTIARAGRYGAIGLGVDALGYVASQSTAGQQAIQWVQGFWRTNPTTGQTSYVAPHQRRVT